MIRRQAWIAVTVAFLLQVGDTRAQQVTTSIERTGSSQVYTFDLSWPMGLSAQIDTLGITRLDSLALTVLSGGVLSVSDIVGLSDLAPKRVMIRQQDFDEVSIAAGSLPSALDRPSAELVAPGMYRKRPVASLVVRLVDYDASAGKLRRYRRIVVEVPDRGQVASKLSAPMQFSSRVTESVLSSGTIFKIPVDADGVYRIDRQLLIELGLQPDGIEPNRVQVYSNGGIPLPAPNSESRVDDLAELPVFVTGGGDGSFAANDAVVFFAKGPSGWKWNNTTERWEHYVNPFSVSNYVFVKIGSTASRQPTTPGEDPGVADATFTQSTGRYFADFDDFNWSKEHGSGLTWVSNPIQVGGRLDVFSNLTLPGELPGPVRLVGSVAISSNPITSVDFSSSGQSLATVRAAFAISSRSDQPTAAATAFDFSAVRDGSPFSLQMTVVNQSNAPSAALDYIRAFYPRSNQAVDGMLSVHTEGETGLIEHAVSGFATMPVALDITDPGNIVRLDVWPAGSEYRVQLQASVEQQRQAVLFQTSSAQSLSGDLAVPVANQNLHGITSYPDLVIFSPTELLAEANDFANYRRSGGLDVTVIEMSKLYNEFSGGLTDMRAVRDYLKFLYDRAPDEASLPRYALLFGDGHFDFRGLRPGVDQTPNFVPPYETVETYNPDASYTSDDYFGLLDDEEGEWVYRGYSVVSSERIDVGVGRFPVKSTEEAAALVAKIKRYEDASTYGSWRSRYTYVADDAFNGSNGSTDEGDLHMYNMDSVAEYVKANVEADVDVRKIYADSYERVFLTEAKIPGARQAILNALDEGTLVFNYSGHGGPVGLAQEDLFTSADAIALDNENALPVFVTATCSFGWWDIDDRDSGAELLILNPNGGAIAMFTTVRLVYTSASPSDLNPGLNRALNVAMFKRDGDGLPVRFGDAMVETKNTQVGLLGNSRKFNLLGDPSMRLGIPARSVAIDAINGVPIAQAQGQMKALDRVRIAGHVVSSSGLPDVAFSGKVTLTVFDAIRRVPINEYRWMPNRYYEVREDLLWRGDVAVTGGAFEAEFVVPKDISYSDKSGRITAYAVGSADQALGFTENFTVGGTSDNPPDDAVGPEISLFLNDTTFVSGGLTPPGAELIARFSDDSGINTVGSGVGHEMLLVLNGRDADAVDISSAFVSDQNSYQKGSVRWKLDDLPDGANRLTVRAWDVLNNSGSAELEFFVAGNEDLTVRNVYNYPNPMSARTRFVFEHNQPSGTPAEVQIRIYTLNGRPIRTITSDEALPTGTLTAGPVQIEWDGRDEDFDRVATGIYLYKIRLEVDTLDGQRQVVERIERIAIIR